MAGTYKKHLCYDIIIQRKWVSTFNKSKWIIFFSEVQLEVYGLTNDFENHLAYTNMGKFESREWKKKKNKKNKNHRRENFSHLSSTATSLQIGKAIFFFYILNLKGV